MTKFTFEQCLFFWLLFKVARNRLSPVFHWNAKFTNVLPFMFLKSTQGCKKSSKNTAKSIKCSDIMSENIAILVGHLQHFGQTMPDV